MAGGYKQIRHEDGNHFTSENQPKNRRTSTKMLTDLMVKMLEGDEEIIVSGVDMDTGKPCRMRITLPSKTTIVAALFKKAAKGDVNAIREVLDRVEGKVTQPIAMEDEVVINVTHA